MIPVVEPKSGGEISKEDACFLVSCRRMDAKDASIVEFCMISASIVHGI